MTYQVPLEYARPTPPPTTRGMTDASVGRFFLGFGFYFAVVFVIVALQLFGHALGEIGWFLRREPTLWLFALCALGLVVCVQVVWRATAFTLGVVAGGAATLIVAGTFFAWLWYRLGGWW